MGCGERRAEHLSQCLGAPHLWALLRVLPPASPTHHPGRGAGTPKRGNSPSAPLAWSLFCLCLCRAALCLTPQEVQANAQATPLFFAFK